MEKTKKTKGKHKYDFASLKLEFMKSDFDEVKAFFTDKGLIFNSDMVRKTKGWTKEKKENKKKIAQRTIEKTIERESTKLSQQIDVDKLIRMKNDFINTIDLEIQKLQASNKINMRDVVTGLNAIKTELGETTSINQNKNETEITGMNITFTGV